MATPGEAAPNKIRIDRSRASHMEWPPGARDNEPVAQNHRVTARSGSSFYGAMRLLRPHRREGQFPIYSFCLGLGDIATDPLPVSRKISSLPDWRCESRMDKDTYNLHY